MCVRDGGVLQQGVHKTSVFSLCCSASRAKRSHRPAAPRCQPHGSDQTYRTNPSIIFNNFFIYQLFENLKTVLAMVHGDDKRVKIS